MLTWRKASEVEAVPKNRQMYAGMDVGGVLEVRLRVPHPDLALPDLLVHTVPSPFTAPMDRKTGQSQDGQSCHSRHCLNTIRLHQRQNCLTLP
jgi:hypothetical protein